MKLFDLITMSLNVYGHYCPILNLKYHINEFDTPPTKQHIILMGYTTNIEDNTAISVSITKIVPTILRSARINPRKPATTANFKFHFLMIKSTSILELPNPINPKIELIKANVPISF